MAEFTDLPIPRQKLSEVPTISSLAVGGHILTVTASGVFRIQKGDIGFARLFVQAGAPTGQTTQDIWIDTGSGNSVKVWNGSDWVARNFAASAGSIPVSAIEDIATQRLLGRVTADSGSVEILTPAQVRTILDVAEGANNYVHPNHTGDVTSDGDGATTIADNAVGNGKLAQMPARTIKANGTAAAADAQDIAIAENQFLARGSAGDLEAKPITNFMLTLAGLGNAEAAKSHLEVPELVFVPVLMVDGDTSTPSTVHFQLRDSNLNAVEREAFLRVRLCAEGAYAEKGGPDTIAATGGTTLVETFSANQDLVFRSNATGLFELVVTHNESGTSTIRCGVPPVSSEDATYTQTLNITAADVS